MKRYLITISYDDKNGNNIVYKFEEQATCIAVAIARACLNKMIQEAFSINKISYTELS